MPHLYESPLAQLRQRISEIRNNPNGAAYETGEVRTGPPLSYLNDNLSKALMEIHVAYRNAVQYVPENLPGPQFAPETYSVKQDGIVGALYGALDYALTAYLGLNNLLGLMASREVIDQVAELDFEQFEEWRLTITTHGRIAADVTIERATAGRVPDVSEVVEATKLTEVNELLRSGWRLLAVRENGPLYVVGRPRDMANVNSPSTD
jgi:hypothetical protein